uniref:Uncharacterized protein n=1 Tax=Lyngbya majuscula TaxID=158786 RepID=Q6E7J2_9CYAN|nr:hypothetical protein [Lyngbya majuscula]
MTIEPSSMGFSPILRTGAPWRDLPSHYGIHSTVSSRFYRWRKAGVWEKILAGLQQKTDAEGLIDWEVHLADSTVVRAHQHAAGAKGGNKTKLSGVVREVSPQKSTKRAEGFGKPMVFVLTSGERHDTIAFGDLLAGGKVKHIGRGRPKSRFRYFLADKAYSSQAIREKLSRQGATPIIPRKSNEKKRERFNRGLYRERNRVERLINRLKQNRRIATRYEKYAINYQAMLTIASILLWL